MKLNDKTEGDRWNMFGQNGKSNSSKTVNTIREGTGEKKEDQKDIETG